MAFMTGLGDVQQNQVTAEFENGVQGVASDFDKRLFDKMDRVAAKADAMKSSLSFSSLNLHNSGVTYDGDNLSNDLRLAGSDGTSYDAWETAKDEDYFQGKTTDANGNIIFDKAEALNRQNKIRQQMAELEARNGWDAGTATPQDVFAEGEKAKQAKQKVLDEYAAKYGKDFNMDINPVGEDQSGYNRTIAQVIMPDGRNLADILNTEANNSKFQSKYNQKKIDEKNFALQQSEAMADKDAIFNNDSLGSSIGNTALAGLGGISTATGKMFTAGTRAWQDGLVLAQTEEAQKLDYSIAKKEKAGEKLTPIEQAYKEGKYRTSDKKKKLEGMDKLTTDLLDYNPVTGPARWARRKLAEGYRSLDEGNDEYKRGKKIAELEDFNKGSDEIFGTVSKKYVNNKDERDYERQAEKGSGGDFKNAIKTIGSAIDSGDYTKAMKGAGRAVQGVGKMVKNLYDHPGVAAQITSQSAAEMFLLTKASGLTSLATVNELTNKADSAYRATHEGKAATGKDKLIQVAGAIGVAAIQKGGTDYALHPFKKLFDRVGLFPSTTARVGSKEYITLKTPPKTPSQLKIEKLQKDTKGINLKDNALTRAEAKLDAIPEVELQKTIGNKTWNGLKATSKATGVSVYSIIKASMRAGVALGTDGAKIMGAGGVEYGEEFGESVLEQIINQVGTDKPVDWMKAHVSGSLGFGSGASMRGTINAAPAISNVSRAVSKIEKKEKFTPQIMSDYMSELATNDPVKDADNILAGEYSKNIAKYADDDEKKTYVDIVNNARTQLATKATAILRDESLPVEERQAKAMELVGDRGVKLSAHLRELKGEEEPANVTSTAPTLEGKKAEEVTNSDVVAEATNALSHGMLSQDKIDLVDEAIRNGTVDKELGKMLHTLNNLHTKGTKIAEVDKDITIRSGSGTKKASAKGHLDGIVNLVNNGDIRQAKVRAKKLARFAATQNKKLAALDKLMEGDKEYTVWNNKKYYRKGVAKFIENVRTGSEVLDVTSRLADYLIKEGEFNAKQEDTPESSTSNAVQEADAKFQSAFTPDVLALFEDGQSTNASGTNTNTDGTNVTQTSSSSDEESKASSSDVNNPTTDPDPTNQDDVGNNSNKDDNPKNNSDDPIVDNDPYNTNDPYDDYDPSDYDNYNPNDPNNGGNNGGNGNGNGSNGANPTTDEEPTYDDNGFPVITDSTPTSSDTNPTDADNNQASTKDEIKGKSKVKNLPTKEEAKERKRKITRDLIRAGLDKVRGTYTKFHNSEQREDDVEFRRKEREIYEIHNPKTALDLVEYARSLTPPTHKDMHAVLDSVEAWIHATGRDYKVINEYKSKLKDIEYQGEIRTTEGEIAFQMLEDSVKGKHPEEFSYSTVIHELMHLNTLAYLKANPSSKEAIEARRLLELARQDKNYAKVTRRDGSQEWIYGLIDEYEMFAELSNPAFRLFLGRIKDPERKDRGSVLNSLVDLFAKVAEYVWGRDFVTGTLLQSVIENYNDISQLDPFDGSDLKLQDYKNTPDSKTDDNKADNDTEPKDTKPKTEPKREFKDIEVGKLADNINGNNIGSMHDTNHDERASFLNVKPKTAEELGNWLLAKSPDKFTSLVIKATMKFMDATDMNDLPVNIHVRPKKNLYTTDADGNLVRTRNVGEVNKDLSGINFNLVRRKDAQEIGEAFSYATALHEFMHLPMVYKLQNPKNFALLDEARRLIKLIKEHPGAKNADDKYIYGLKNEYELLAELSNPVFRGLLAQITDPEAKGKNLLDSIKNLLKSLLSQILSPLGLAKTVEDSVLESVVSLYDVTVDKKLINTKAKQERSKRVFDYFMAQHNPFYKGTLSLAKTAAMKSKEAKGLLGLSPDALLDEEHLANTIAGLNLEPEMANTLRKVFEFKQKLKGHILNFHKEFDKDKPVYKQILADNTVLTMSTNGEYSGLPDAVFTAMAVTGLRFIGETLNDTFWNDDDAIKSILNDPNMAVTNFTRRHMGTAGTVQGALNSKQGRKILSELNLTESKDAVDGTYFNRLGSSMSNLMLLGLYKEGYIEFKGVTNQVMGTLKGNSRGIQNRNAVTNFVRVKTDRESGEVLPHINAAVKAYNKRGRKTLDHVFDSSLSSVEKPLDKPLSEKDVVKKVKNSYMKVTDLMKKALLRAGRMPFVPNRARLDKFMALSEDTQKAMLGWQDPKAHIAAKRDAINGKNLSIQRDLDNLKAFMEDRKDKPDAPVYFAYRVWRNMRMGTISNQISMQQSKLHRQMFHAKEWTSVIDLKKPASLRGFKEGFEMLTGKKFNDFVTNRGNVKHKFLATAVDMMLSDETEFTKEQEAAMQESLDYFGEGMMGYTLLHSLSDFVAAKRDPSKPTKFTTTGYIETDGITNGTITSQFQTVTSFTDKVKSVLNAGGVFFLDNTFKTVQQFKERHRDNYKQLMHDFRERQIKDNLVGAAPSFDKLMDLVTKPMFDENGDVTSDGRNFAKPYVMTFVYSKGRAAMTSDVNNFIEDSIIEYIDQNHNNQEALKLLDEVLNELRPPTTSWAGFNYAKLARTSNLKENTAVFETNDLKAAFSDIAGVHIADPLVATLNDTYPQIVEARKAINLTLKRAYTLAKAIYDNELMLAERQKYLDNGGDERYANNPNSHVALNKAEKTELIQRLIKDGMMPTINHVSSKSYSDGLLVKEFEDKAVPNERGGYLNTELGQTIERSVLRNVQKGYETEELSNMYANIYESTFSDEIGVKGFLNAILSFDANVQAALMANGTIGGILNVHDAQIWGFKHWLAGSKLANQVFIEHHAKWSLLSEVDAMHTRMARHFNRYAHKYPHLRNKVFIADETKREESKQAIRDVRSYSLHHKDAKKEVIDNLDVNEQFENNGHGMKFTKKAKVVLKNYANIAMNLQRHQWADRDFLGNSPDPINLKKFNGVKSTTITAANVVSTFDGLEVIDRKINAPISVEHKQYLQDYMATTGVGIFNLVDKINYKMRRVKKGRVLGASKGNEVYLKIPKSTLKSNQDMSAQETFAHEVTHNLWENAPKTIKGKVIYGKLAALFNEVKDYIEPEDLLIGENADIYEQARAEDLYSYIFEGKDIAEFGTYGLTNEALIKALKEIKIPKIAIIENNGDMTPFDVLQNLFSRLVSTFLGDTTAFAKLDAMAKQAVALKKNADYKVLENNNPFSDVANDKVAEQLADRLYEPVTKWFKEHPVLYTGSSKVLGVALAPARLGVSGASLVLNAMAHPDIVANLRDLGKEFHKGTYKIFASLLTEIQGSTDRNRDFHNLLRIIKHRVETANIRIAHGTTKQIRERFHPDNEPTKDQWSSLTEVILRTDMGTLASSYTVDSLHALLRDQRFLNQEINKYRKMVASGNVNANMHLLHTENLGRYMVTGEAGLSSTLLNATNIAESYHKVGSYDQILERNIDILASLYAINATNKKKRKDIGELFLREEEINQDNNGVLFLMEMANVAKREALESNFNNDPRLMIKGYVKEQYHDDFKYAHVTKYPYDKKGTAKYIADLEDDGYTIISENKDASGNDVITLINRNTFTQKWQSGILSMNRDKAKGSGTIKAQPEKTKWLNSGRGKLNYKYKHSIPVNGDEKHARHTLTIEERTKFLRMETDASKVIGDTLGSVTVKSRGVEYNFDLMDLMTKDYKEHKGTPQGNFVNINDPDSEYYDMFKLIPDDIREYVILEMGQPKEAVYVNEDYVDLIFGYRKKSLTGLVPKGKEHEATRKFVFHAEQIWQAVISTAKRNVVIYTPKVLIANVVSNISLSMVRGVPAKYVFSKQAEALTAMHKYRKLVVTKDNLIRELATTNVKNRKLMKTKLKRIEAAIETNPVHPLVSDGLYSTIAEDIDIDAVPLIKALNNAVNSLSDAKTNKINKSLETFDNLIPDLAVKAYKTAIISPDTGLAKDLREATQISDFVARYAMYQYRTVEQNVPHDEAVNEVIDVFVNYDWNSSAGLQWANDMGIIMYTKFLIRIQKIILQNFRDRPVNAISMELMQRATVDIPDIADSHIFGAIRLSRLGSPTDNIDQAFELNLLHYFTWLF